MRTALTTLTFMLAGSGSALGATGDFFFFSKLGLLIALGVLVGGLLTFGVGVIASFLWDKIRQSQLQPVRVQQQQPPERRRRVRRE